MVARPYIYYTLRALWKRPGPIMAKSDPKLILLVEDNDDDALLFQRALKKAGFINPVSTVTSVAAAKHYLKGDGPFADRSAHPFPSIMVVDLKLPDGDGVEFLRWVRSQPDFKSLHCLVVTSDFRPSTLQASYASGADSFLCKPCSYQDIKSVADGFPHHWFS